VNPRRLFVPYLLLGILTLGTGLAIGLGLSEGPVTYSATSTSPWAPCSISRNGTATTVTCRSVVSHVTPSSFTWGSQGFESFYERPWKIPKDFVQCMTSALINVVPRTGHISSAKLNRDMGAIYTSCSGFKTKV
jgi:hypothetical protein